PEKIRHRLADRPRLKQNRHDDAAEEEKIHRSLQANANFWMSCSGTRNGRLFASPAPRIPDVKDSEHQPVGEQPLRPEPESPEKIHAAQVSQKQGRIAQRSQQAAQIADNKNEENRHVLAMLSAPVEAQVGPN